MSLDIRSNNLTDIIFNWLSLRNLESFYDESMKTPVNFVTNLDPSDTIAILIVSSLTAEILDSSRAPILLFDCYALLAVTSI